MKDLESTKVNESTSPDCGKPVVSGSFQLFHGSEFGVEKLDLLLVVNFELNKLSRIDLDNPSIRIIDIPVTGIPNHFKSIDNNEFNRLIQKYWS